MRSRYTLKVKHQFWDTLHIIKYCRYEQICMIPFTFSVQHVSTFLFILYFILFVYSIVLYTLVSSTISAFKKFFAYTFASKLWNFVTIWLDDAFLCILLIRLWFHWILHTWKHTKDTLFMFLSYLHYVRKKVTP